MLDHACKFWRWFISFAAKAKISDTPTTIPRFQVAFGLWTTAPCTWQTWETIVCLGWITWRRNIGGFHERYPQMDGLYWKILLKLFGGITPILGNLQFAKSHLEVTKGILFRALGLRVCDVPAQYHAWQVMKWRDGAKAGQERSRCPPSLLRKSCLHRLMDVNCW